MKRCPECRRDYYDETLLYCLDDGNALLEGPATADPAEPKTALISPGVSDEALSAAESQTRVQNDTAGSTVILPADSIPARRSGKKLSVVMGLSLALLVAGVIGVTIYKLRGGRGMNISFEAAKITRLTNSGRVTNRTAISPDGKWLVYANQEGDQQSLWLKQVAIPDSNTQIVPPATLRYTGLAFSPDGNYLYYTVFETGAPTGVLYQVPVLGGAAKKLFTGIWDRITFSPDGKQISYFDYIDDEDRLMIANADGTGQRQLAVRKGNEFFVSGSQVAAWSPDGKTIATTIGVQMPRSMSLATVSVATGEAQPFSKQNFDWAAGVTWLSDGSGVLVLGSENLGQPQQIWQISYPSGEARKVSNDLNQYSVISLTADSAALATVQAAGSANIWIAAFDDIAHATQVTAGSDTNGFPVWTPDGRLIYSRNSLAAADLYVVDPRGGSPKQLTSNAGANMWPTVSPDGRYVVLVSSRTGTDCLWKIDMDGGDPVQLTTTSASAPNFSPDGREIIYEGNANKTTIWKVALDGGEPVQLTQEESGNPRFSPDGKQFVCLHRDDARSAYKLAIISSNGGPVIKSFPVGNVSQIRWIPDGRSIAYAVNKGDVGNVWLQPLDGGAARQLTNFTSQIITSFDLSRDGKQIAISRLTRTSDVVLISGFKK
jgi:Tol biopolymer transport system component